MTKLTNTLSFRLTLWYASTFVFFIFAAFLISYLSIHAILDSRMDDDLMEDISEFKLLYESDGIEGVKREIKREMYSDDQSSAFLRLLDHNGNQLFGLNLSEYWQGIKSDKTIISTLNIASDPVLLTEAFSSQEYDTRIIYGYIAPGLILHAGESVAEKEEMMGILITVISVMFVIVIPLASLVSWFMARRAVRGIEEISRTASNIESGHLDKRVTVTKAHGSEIQVLADAFNSMLDRIRDLVAELREMSDNIAHDLRSPLGRIRAFSELAFSKDRTIDEYKMTASKTIEECDRMLQMINATLDVAEAEAGINDTVREKIDISELVKDACELFEPVAEEKEIELICAIGSGCFIHGNVQYLQRMVANLVDNALKYTPAKGTVGIDLVCSEKQIKIAVSDSGIGIPASEQVHIFDRFYRCDNSRSQEGCGMGLSFSQAVARAHGGEISVASKPGAGTSFSVKLPR